MLCEGAREQGKDLVLVQWFRTTGNQSDPQDDLLAEWRAEPTDAVLNTAPGNDTGVNHTVASIPSSVAALDPGDGLFRYVLYGLSMADSGEYACRGFSKIDGNNTTPVVDHRIELEVHGV